MRTKDKDESTNKRQVCSFTSGMYSFLFTSFCGVFGGQLPSASFSSRLHKVVTHKRTPNQLTQHNLLTNNSLTNNSLTPKFLTHNFLTHNSCAHNSLSHTQLIHDQLKHHNFLPGLPWHFAWQAASDHHFVWTAWRLRHWAGFGGALCSHATLSHIAFFPSRHEQVDFLQYCCKNVQTDLELSMMCCRLASKLLAHVGAGEIHPTKTAMSSNPLLQWQS